MLLRLAVSNLLARMKKLIIISYFKKITPAVWDWINYHTLMDCGGAIITNDKSAKSPSRDWDFIYNPEFTHLELEAGQVGRYYPGVWKLTLKNSRYLYAPNMDKWINCLEKNSSNGISIPTYYVNTKQNFAYAGDMEENEMDLFRLSPLRTWEWSVASKKTSYKSLISSPDPAFVIDFSNSNRSKFNKHYKMEDVFLQLGINHEDYSNTPGKNLFI